MSEDLQPKSPDPVIGPECLAGKHGNCYGDAWDFVEDAPAECQCACHAGGAS